MNAIFTGRKRSGKTTLAFDKAMKEGGGIIIFDPKREWRGWPSTTTVVAEIPDLIKKGNEIIIFHPQGDVREAFTPLVDLVLEMHNIAMANNWDKDGYHFTFIVDEAVNVSTAQFVDKKLLALVAVNRPEILNIYLTFQSPKDANNLLKTRFESWYIFNTSLPSDLEYLHKEVGVPEEDLEQIKCLRPRGFGDTVHEYAHFYFDGGQPHVEFERDSESWFRPLEFFELNYQERKEAEHLMANDRGRRRNESGWLESIVKEFKDDILDMFEDDGYEIREPREGRRENRRERERSGSRLSGY
jgi:hypothetical protein